ncbi:transmembrane protein 117-like, partial [Limulus polyphemus]|uniref:Transmembrane protein 117-like n=1 Tax=Limulus polyphemus TaxID=6850 RepID=A0ABM1SWZ3_LIMPO
MSTISTFHVDSWSSLCPFPTIADELPDPFLTQTPPVSSFDGFFHEYKLPRPSPLAKDHYQPLAEEGTPKTEKGGQLPCKVVTETLLQWDPDSLSVYSLKLEKDFRYFFQHPYARLFVSYFVIFCNFLIFAEDPVSHSHTESEIPVVGNVFSFIATKYPSEWTWCLVKVALWLFAIVIGLEVGKHFIHNCFLRNILRLKMFREERGTWMIMFLTVVIFIYIFSLVYNAFLLSSYHDPEPYRITGKMGITNMSFMKVAASGTWLGDFFTAWMVTDMMLQDNLYVDWAKPARTFWKSHGRVRIVIFWAGSTIMTAVVVTLIASDWITWDRLNRDFVATTELSRAFLASFILVMDLLIVIQDWDFPHFVCDLDIKLPGMHVASFKYRMFQKYVSIPDVVFHITGKWFNYGIIIFVMILDLNMLKNQIFYSPKAYGQYIGPNHKIYTVADQRLLAT